MCLKLSNAIQILDENLDEIYTVTQWAERAGFKDAKYFSRLFRNRFGIRPKKYIKLKKLERFDELIKQKPPILHYEIALNLGLADETGLYKYIKRHTRESPSHWAENGGLPRSLFSPLKGIEKRDRKKG